MLFAIFSSLLPLAFKDDYLTLTIIDQIACCIFIIDYLLRWITADIRNPRFGFWMFIFYPFTPMAIIDLLSILPSINVINNTFKVLRTTRLIKIVRVFKFIRYYEPLQLTIRVLKKERQILLTVLTFSIFYILLIALIMFNVEDVNPKTGEIVFNNFFEAVYWSVCTLTTIGYGDFYPTTTIGRVICMISALMGIAIIALPSGAITSAYMEEIKERRQKSK